MTSLRLHLGERLRASLPSACMVCHRWGRHAVCTDCLHSFAPPRQRCTTCALPLFGAGQTRCGACLTLGTTLDACHAAVDYAYPWDKLIQRLKYSDGGDLRAQPALALSVARVIEHVAQSDAALTKGLQQAGRSDWIIPVALHPERQKERGFNQANALAQALFPGHTRLRKDMLLRIHHTAVQANLPRDARAFNLRGAFIAAPLLAHELKGAKVTLIDDVTTTTATLSAAAMALRQAGAHEVHAVVFARAS
jgi:ComF family protein